MDQNKAKASGLRTNCNLSMGGDRQCEVYEHQKNDQQRTSVPAYGALVKPVATPDSWDNTQKPKFPFNSSASQVNGYGGQNGTLNGTTNSQANSTRR